MYVCVCLFLHTLPCVIFNLPDYRQSANCIPYLIAQYPIISSILRIISVLAEGAFSLTVGHWFTPSILGSKWQEMCVCLIEEQRCKLYGFRYNLDPLQDTDFSEYSMLSNLRSSNLFKFANRSFKAKQVAFSYECQRCDYDDFQNFICKVLILVDTILTLPQYFSMANKHFNESRYSQTDTSRLAAW